VGEQDETYEHVDQALTTRASKYKLDWVSQPELAAVRAQDLLPHIVLLDDELGGADITLLIRQMLNQAPGTVVLVLLEENAIGQARKAVLAGARGFVTKPFTADEFVATLRQVLAPGQGPATEGEKAQTTGGRIVVFCAPKGGTGRTTMMVNSSLSLHRTTQKSVVMVDADFASPALDVVLNLHDHRDITDLLKRASRLDHELVASVLAPHGSGVQVLLAPPPAELTDPITLPQAQQILSQLKRTFDWVIVDLGLPTDQTAFAFLDAADRIVMSVLPEMVGLRNTRLMLDQLYSRGYAEDKIWLVINRSTIRGGISKQDIERRLHVRVQHTIPDDQPLVSHSVNRGVPLVLSHERSAVAKAMLDLAQQLSRDASVKVQPTSTQKATQGNALQRLLRRPRTANA